MDELDAVLGVNCDMWECSPCDLARITNTLGEWIYMSSEVVPESEMAKIKDAHQVLFEQAKRQGVEVAEGVTERDGVCSDCEDQLYISEFGHEAGKDN